MTDPTILVLMFAVGAKLVWGGYLWGRYTAEHEAELEAERRDLGVGSGVEFR
jgi:hypothetical protein